MDLKPEVVDGIIKGITSGKSYDINNGGSVSWSVKYKVAESFATAGDSTVPVIFRVKNMKNATAVEHLTSIHNEHEVISSKKNMFRPIKAVKKNIQGEKGWLIDVEQIE